MKKLIFTIKKISIILLFAQATIFISCKKFVEVPLPVDQLTSDFIFNNDKTAVQALTGIYSEMINNNQLFSSGQTTFLAGMSADELYNYTPGDEDAFVNNSLSANGQPNIDPFFWKSSYRFIYAANRCIEEVNKSTTLSPAVMQMIIGEAKFIRAFCYYYLVNLFGDVPLIISTDYQSNQSLSRTAKTLVYDQIISDLKDAQHLLLVSYPSGERARPNKLAATALLARVYITVQDWVNAEATASNVISSGVYNLNVNLNNVFLSNSNETIWQLKPVAPSRNTWEAFYLIPTSSTVAPTYLLTSSFINSFESNDQRKISWAKAHLFGGQTHYYPYKYKVQSGTTVTENYIVLRMAEQYLIRAEARAQQNNILGSQSDINQIRNRAGLSNTTSNDKASLLSAIEQERRVELFAEWGHRWFDLKRTGRASAVLGLSKPSTWQPTDELWPIPQSQINLNPSLTQNSGY